MEDLNNNETVTMDSELLTKAIGACFGNIPYWL